MYRCVPQRVAVGAWSCVQFADLLADFSFLSICCWWTLVRQSASAGSIPMTIPSILGETWMVGGNGMSTLKGINCPLKPSWTLPSPKLYCDLFLFFFPEEVNLYLIQQFSSKHQQLRAKSTEEAFRNLASTHSPAGAVHAECDCTVSRPPRTGIN